MESALYHGAGSGKPQVFLVLEAGAKADLLRCCCHYFKAWYGAWLSMVGDTGIDQHS